jgi:hypothetical protein
MAVDTVAPLATSAQMTEGAFADLARAFSPQALDEVMVEATRACEGECSRRLAPFTGLTETHRLSGVDPDEYADSANLPLDLAGTLGRSYAASLGTSSLVRHLWLEQYATLYPDLWSYSDLSITVTRSYGGSEHMSVGAGGFVGPDPDTGHVWFTVGKWLPVGSFARATYSGGYRVIPADLSRAAKYFAAAILCRELAPLQANHGHDPDQLEALAVSWLSPYARS